MKLARISCPIALQAISKKYPFGLVSQTSVEGMFLTMYVDFQQNEILFLRVVSRGPISCSSPPKFWERLGGMAVPTRKARLAGLLRASTRQAASALLELSSSTLSSWQGLCQQPDWAPHRLGARTLVPCACSWSLQGHEPNSTASSTSGSSKDFFAINDRPDDWRAAMCWLVLGGPWKACLWSHKTGQSPTRRVIEKTPQLVGVLVFNLVSVLVEPL